MSSPVLLYLTKHHCVGTSQIYYLHCNELYDDDDDDNDGNTGCGIESGNYKKQ
jgi:hypothetical protein